MLSVMIMKLFTIQNIPSEKKPLARNMVVPLLFLVTSIFMLLLTSGNGNIANGDGSMSVFSSGVLTLIFSALFYKIQGICTVDRYVSWVIEGMTGMFSLTMILVLAYSFSSMLSVLGTASYIASFTVYLPGSFILPASLLIAAVISYATGTSGGTKPSCANTHSSCLCFRHSSSVYAWSHNLRICIRRPEFPYIRQRDSLVNNDRD